MDVINFISKTPGLPDATVEHPDQEFQFGGEHYAQVYRAVFYFP